MVNNDGQTWVGEMDLVVHNFHILLDEVKKFHSAPDERRSDDYNLHKRQLWFNMLFDIGHIILSGMKVIIRDPSKVPSELYEVLERLEKLQDEISKLGNFSLRKLKDLENQPNRDLLCPNPLVLFLKMAVESATIGSRLSDIQGFLETLKLKRSNRNGQSYTPGMPGCVLALENLDSTIIISASKDQYEWPELKKASEQYHTEQLGHVRSKCTNQNSKNWMFQLEELSAEFMEAASLVKNKGGSVDIKDGRMTRFVTRHATQCQVVLTPKGSKLATWTPQGDYKISCLLDHYRFQTDRPEGNQGGDRKVFRRDSCAEWFCFIELARLPGEIETTALTSSLQDGTRDTV